MTNFQPKFSFIQFEVMTWREWKFQYLSDLRVSHALDDLGDLECGLILADKNTPMYLPEYKNKQDWRYGIPRKVSIGNRLTLLRVPAIKYKDKFLILDACHRLTNLKPKMVLLDYVILPEKKRKYVTDLISDFWD